MPRYFANVARTIARVGPDDYPFALGVLSDRLVSASIIGTAYGSGHLGGWRTDFSKPGFPSEDLGPREAVWRLVIGKAEVEGRFALRRGEFVELAEDAL
jgi:hypothetical protein